jgi:TonB family protein
MLRGVRISLKLLSGLLLVALGAGPQASAQVVLRTEPLPVKSKLERPEAIRVAVRDLPRFRQLRGDEPEKHFPEQARKEALDGIVIVDLLLNAQGQVLEAEVIAESPAGKGFGLAALDTAKTLEFTNPLQRMVLMSINVEFLP